jgi:hypothetical protein
MRTIIFLLGAIISYEVLAQIAEYNRRTVNLTEDARKHRLRLVNRNQEIAY